MKKLTKLMVSIISFVLFLTSASLAENKWVPIMMDNFTTFVSYATLPTNNLEVPTFSGNSQGKLVIQCENDIVYYIMAYDCLRWDTKTSVTVNIGDVVIDEEQHVGEIFYTMGHIERTGPVTITGHVYSGGKDLYIWPDWIKTCP